MAKFKDYYRLLNIEPFSGLDAVKSAYRKLARQYHPDLNPGDKQSEERFKEINEAYEMLSHADKKKVYDNTLRIKRYQETTPREPAAGKSDAKARQPQPDPAAKKAGKAESQKKPRDPEPRKSVETPGTSTPISDLFETFLKNRFSGAPKAAGPSSAQAGGQSNFQANAQTPQSPQNPGTKREAKREVPKRGEDVTVETVISPLESEQGVIKTVNVQHNELCRRCSGTGKVNGLVCPGCNGEKVLVRLKKIDVRIPGGVKTGSKVRVAGEGGRGSGGMESGDLYLLIKISVDPTLRIDGLDVYCDFPISVTEAVLGAEVDVPTLTGPVKMTVPPRTSSGRVFRLKEMGVRNGISRGDQFVTVAITVPENISAKERELYEELAKLHREKPR